MRVYTFLVLYVAMGTALPVYLHWQTHAVVCTTQVALAFFLALNVLICLWEVGLGLHLSTIEADYKRLLKTYGGGTQRLRAVVDLMMHELTVADTVSLRFWSRIWSTYSLYDPSYSNRESFGFFVDVGNGWTTLVPSLMFLYCMTHHDVVNARLLGVVGMIKFYQEFYGTCIYFLSFFFNRRHVGKSVGEVVGFVGFSNGLWFVFPLVGMLASYHLIDSNSYSVFLS